MISPQASRALSWSWRLGFERLPAGGAGENLLGRSGGVGLQKWKCGSNFGWVEIWGGSSLLLDGFAIGNHLSGQVSHF